MKYTLWLFLSIIAFTSIAQHERDNWILSSGLRMKFENDTVVVFPKDTSSIVGMGSATYSNPITGELLFYAMGSKVFNKLRQQMPNGFDINDEKNASQNIIIPNPLNKNIYHIVSSSYQFRKLYFSTIDMRLESGLGDIIEKGKLISDSADMPVCVVKQLYNQGYWLITHTPRSNEFKSYRIDANGLNASAVVSYAGSASTESPQINYNSSAAGKMISASTGERFVFGHPMYGGNAICEEFFFDKKCGTVSFNQAFENKYSSRNPAQVGMAYSGNDSLLYVKWIYTNGKKIAIIQYNVKDRNPNDSALELFEIDYGNLSASTDIQLASDGKIYTSNYGLSTIGYIQYPNIAGVGCGYNDQYLFFVNYGSIGSFPQFIMDTSMENATSKYPELFIKHSCNNTIVSFSVNEFSISVDSFYWDFGDSTIAKTIDATHEYDSVGDYYISFNWYVCNQKYTIMDTLILRATPVFSLGNDTTLCVAKALVLFAPPDADAYKWSTGYKGAVIVVDSPGIYSVKVKTGDCEYEDEIKIDFAGPIWTALGDEYFICDENKELVKLDAGNDFTQYKWTPTGDATQWIIVGSIADYFVVVKDYRGCDGNDGTKVKRCCPVTVFYPNVFTPNADGKNDTYLPIGNDVVGFVMTIYNAWGQQIFTTNNILTGWDGMVQGKLAPDGVYIYQSSYSGYRNKRLVSFDVKGNVTLLR